MTPLEEWFANAGPGQSDLEVMDKILSGTADPAKFQPNLNVLEAFKLDKGKPLWILDFGAGMLRNTVGLLEMSPLWQVRSYDPVPQMLYRGLKHFRSRLEPVKKRLALSSTWNVTSDWKYDAIVCVLVLQHLPAEELRQRLLDFRTLLGFDGKLCVYGRRSLDDVSSDDWSPKWPIILDHFTPEFTFSGMDSQWPSADKLENGNRHDHTGARFMQRTH